MKDRQRLLDGGENYPEACHHKWERILKKKHLITVHGACIVFIVSIISEAAGQ